MSLKKNYIYNVSLQIINLIYPLFTLPYISKVIGPEGVGRYNFIMSLTQYYIIFSALGITAYGVREIARVKNDKPKRDQLFNELVSINAINSIFSSLIYFLMLFLVPKLQPDINYFFIGGIFVLFSFTNIDWFFAGIEEFKLITLRNIIIKLISLFLLFSFVKYDSDFKYYFAVSFFGLFANNFINFILITKFVKIRFILNIKAHIRSLFFLFATIFATSVYTLLDTIILGFLTNNKYVGYYNISLKLYQVCLPIVTGLGIVMLPRMATALECGNTEEYNSLIKKSISFNFFISIPISFFIFLFSKELVEYFASPDFFPAVDTIRILAPLVVIVGFSNILILQVLNSMRLESYMLYAVLAGSFTSIISNFLLIPVYFHNGSAIATFLTEITVCVFLAYFVFKKTPVRYSLKVALFSCVSLLPYYLIYLSFYDNTSENLFNFFIINIGGIFTYIFSMYFIFKNEFLNSIFHFLKSKSYL